MASGMKVIWTCLQSLRFQKPTSNTGITLTILEWDTKIAGADRHAQFARDWLSLSSVSLHDGQFIKPLKIALPNRCPEPTYMFLQPQSQCQVHRYGRRPENVASRTLAVQAFYSQYCKLVKS